MNSLKILTKNLYYGISKRNFMININNSYCKFFLFQNYSQHAAEHQKPKQKIQPGQKRFSLPNLVENGISASKIAKISSENVNTFQAPVKTEPTGSIHDGKSITIWVP